jgi:hypothetical protein
MSHATVMVIGPTSMEELETALAPFDEEISVDPYFSPIPDYLREKQKKGESLSEFAARLTSEWGEDHTVGEVNGVKVVGSMSTYNPIAKWDWYQVGGRWRGSLPLKAGVPADAGRLGESGVFDNEPMYEGGVDVAHLGDIDFDLKRTNAISRAKAQWEQVDEALDGRSLPILPAADMPREVWQTWWKNPIVADVTAALGNSWGLAPQDLVDLVADPDHYYERMGNDAVLCYSTLHEGEWIEPGRMGWFGISSDTGESRDEYAKRVNELLSSLPDDTMIWVVDYHI